MAFGDLLQRIARSLEEARVQQPGDDLRARLGYGTEDEVEGELASDAVWEPEAEPDPGAARRRRPAWEPATVWRPEASGTPERASATRPAFETHPTPPAGSSLKGSASPATAPHPHTSPASVLSERIRARLRTPDALREAFVVKEILDRPLGRRRRR